MVTRESLALLLEHHDSSPDIPWFACASYSRPHSPLTAPGRYVRRYLGIVPPPAVGADAKDQLEPYAQRMEFTLTDDQTMRAREGYYASVDFVDDCIGELLDGLEKAGMLDNTIVIYTSDHGEMLGNYGCWGKGLYYESSVGVPLLISGPDVKTGRSVSHPISLMDLYPTTCGLAELPIPDGLDGVDFSGVLRDSGPVNPPRNFVPSAFYQYGRRIEYGKISDHTPCAAWRSIRQQNWKYIEVEHGSTLLFDLGSDPHETTNLAESPRQAARCHRMRVNLYQDFSWEQIHRQLKHDLQRLPEFASGLQPSTPNQYMLSDGRVFDAEKSLYDARWLPIPPGCTGGIIPQQFG